MPLNDNAFVVSANALRTALAYAQFNAPAGGGAVGARIAIPWAAVASDGTCTNSADIVWTGLPANQPVGTISFHSASTGGTDYGSAEPTGDLAADSSGRYAINAGDLDLIKLA